MKTKAMDVTENGLQSLARIPAFPVSRVWACAIALFGIMSGTCWATYSGTQLGATARSPVG